MVPLTSDEGIVLPDTSILKRSHQKVVRVSVLDDLFNPIPGAVLTGDAGLVISGRVSMQRGRLVRRTLDVEIVNEDGAFTPEGPLSLFYWNRLLRVERGVYFAGVPYYAPLGVFLIDAPSVDGRASVLSVSGSDRCDRGTRSEFTSPVSYASGSSVGSVIQMIGTDAGMWDDRWSISDGGATLGTTRSYEAGDGRMAAIQALLTDFSLEMFADANGWIRIQPKVDPATAPVAWTFERGAEATMLGISKKWSRDRFYNHILVTGEAADRTPVRGEASDTNPSSPTRVTGPMGDRLFKYTSGMVTTVAQAQAVAQTLLWEHTLIEEEIDLAHIVNPMLEAGDAIIIREAVTRTDDKYLIEDLTVPLGSGAASLSVKKARALT